MSIFITENKKKQSETLRKKLRKYDLLSKLIFVHGNAEKVMNSYSQIEAAKYWQFDDLIPTKGELFPPMTKYINWYIRNNTPMQHPIWNGSFLHGICRGGKVPKRNTKLLLTWWENKQVFDILKNNPFGQRPFFYEFRGQYSWSSCALALPYDKKSISYLAGMMAVARPFVFRFKPELGTFASFPPHMLKDLEELKIPIEMVGKISTKKRILISPIFPALLQNHMPEGAPNWNKIKNPYRGVIYSAILWKTYGLFEFTKGAIPYLKSRRWMFYNLKTNKLFEDTEITIFSKTKDKRHTTGAMSKLDRFWVEYGLTELDSRFRMVIQEVKRPEENSETLTKEENGISID